MTKTEWLILTEEQQKTIETPFLNRFLKQHPDAYRSNLSDATINLACLNLPDDFKPYLDQHLANLTDHALLLKLVEIRTQWGAIIALRELLGLDTIKICCRLTSDVSDALIQWCYQHAFNQLSQRYGTPMGKSSNQPQSLIVLGMGKLGGQELNFSSDIDVMFIYLEEGSTQSETRSIENQEFFIRLGQALVRLLSASAGQQFLYRVDLRLRPFGTAGAIASSADALATYYQQHARAWERFALGKARAITGEPHHINQLMPMIKAFVFRRYIDFSILEDLRNTKALIKDQLEKKADDGWNVKLGQGGIREVEFLLQSQQLIYAGRHVELRQAGVFASMPLLIDHGLIAKAMAKHLPQDYALLRKIENRLQYWNEAQTHVLPTQPEQQLWLARSLGFTDYSRFMTALSQTQQRVFQAFNQLVFTDKTREPANTTAWLNLTDSDALTAALQPHCPGSTESIDGRIQPLLSFINTRAIQSLSERPKRHMEQLVSHLIQHTPLKDLTLFTRTLKFLNSIALKSAYLALLAENLKVFELLTDLFQNSTYLTDEVTQHPHLLDLLLSPESFNIPPNRASLRQQISAFLKSAKSDQVERRLNLLREFKRSQTLKVANANLNKRIDIAESSAILTWLADVTLRHALRVSLTMMGNDHPFNDDIGELPFMIIGYGKLGSGELGLNSDLDIVFLYDETHPDSTYDYHWFGRLARKLLQVLTALTPSGTLYEIDARLRPDGRSGTMVASFEQFEKYQTQRAWTWERQALIKARSVAGSYTLARRFAQLRRKLLCQTPDSETLRSEVIAMRQKMSEHLDTTASNRFNIKHGSGGLVDAEFLCQFLTLTYAHKHPSITLIRNLPTQLERLAQLEPALSSLNETLSPAYLQLRQAVFDCDLQGIPATLPSDQLLEARQTIADDWQRWVENKPN